MADYYSILKKTIEGLPNNTPEIRQAVYRKARGAIETQLRGMEPTPSDTAIATQLRLLEESILVIDAEYAPAPITEPAAVSPIPNPAPQQPAPAPSPPPAPVQEPVAQSPVQPDTAPVPPPVSPQATPEPVQVSAPADQTPAMDTVAISQLVEEVAPVAPPPTVTSVPGPETASVAAAPVSDPAINAAVDVEKKKGGLGKIISALVVLGLIAGGGYVVWANKDALQPMLTSLTAETADTPESAEAEKPLSDAEKALEEDTSAQVEKEAVKLGQNGEDKAVSEPQEEAVRIIEPEPDRKPLDEILANEDEVSGQDSTPAVEPVEEVAETSGNETPSIAGEENSVTEVQTDQPQTLSIGEVAYLYEEGSAGAGASRTNAAITWAIKRESIADGLPPESVIVGAMDVPERNLSVDIEIKRNVDEAVSASHLIEMRFSVPEGFSGGGIDNIARFVMKSTEEARGEPLVAVPVKVSDGFFLIALDNLQQAVSVNTQLLTDSLWIDIPISYSTGKRALITLEKGGTGEQVFRDAFKDWENR